MMPRKPSASNAGMAKNATTKPRPTKKKRSAKTQKSASAPMMEGMRPPVDTAQYPYHLKWQEKGIHFELHACDGAFMSGQAWRVQVALAGVGKKPNAKKAKTKTAKPAASAHHPTAQPPETTPQPAQGPPPVIAQFPREEFSTQQYHEWLNSEQHRLARLNASLPPERKTYAPAPVPSVDLPPFAVPASPHPSADILEQMVNKTMAAFQQQKKVEAPLPSPSQVIIPQPPQPTQADASIPHSEAPPNPAEQASSSEPEIFDRMLRDVQRKTQGAEAPTPLAEKSPVAQRPPANLPGKPAPGLKQMLAAVPKDEKATVLLVAGYYLKQKSQEAFGLSELRDLVMEANGVSLNHGTLEEAIAQRFVEVVPDLTGQSVKMAYRLTPQGQRYAASLLAHV